MTLTAADWVLRYRYLTEYSRLPREPQRKEPQIDLFPDSQEGDSKPGLQNYLDEVTFSWFGNGVDGCSF